jgi:transcription elongation GreA/GreB family factor
VLPEKVRREDCVSLDSEVTYAELAKLDKHLIKIVCPRKANQIIRRVSVLSPIGLAFIGRKISSVVEVNLPSGRVQLLTILETNSLFSSPGSHPLRRRYGQDSRGIKSA